MPTAGTTEHRCIHNQRRNPLAVDPTRTTTIRRRFENDVKRRMFKLKSHLREFLVGLDALGMKERHSFIRMDAQPREFEFLTNPAKLLEFNAWFTRQVQQDVLSVPPGTPSGDPWTARYVESAYKRGQINAYLQSKQAAFADSVGVGDQTQEQFLRDSFNAPERMSKVQLLATRSFEQLKGVTSQMGSDMNRILSQGMIDGKGPGAIAKEMSERIDGLTRTRAMLIARTEVIHAHAEGQLDSYEDLGVEELGVQAEWSTAGDDRVCEQCAGMEGEVFPVKEAHGLIPFHPNCRCSWLPYDETLQGKKLLKEKAGDTVPVLPRGTSIEAGFSGRYEGSLFHGTSREVIDALRRGEFFRSSTYGQGALEWNFGTTEARTLNFQRGGLVVVQPSKPINVAKDVQIYRDAADAAREQWTAERDRLRELFGRNSTKYDAFMEGKQTWISTRVSEIVTSKGYDAYMQGADTIIVTNPNVIRDAKLLLYGQEDGKKVKIGDVSPAVPTPVSKPVSESAPVPIVAGTRYATAEEYRKELVSTLASRENDPRVTEGRKMLTELKAEAARIAPEYERLWNMYQDAGRSGNKLLEAELKQQLEPIQKALQHGGTLRRSIEAEIKDITTFKREDAWKMLQEQKSLADDPDMRSRVSVSKPEYAAPAMEVMKIMPYSAYSEGDRYNIGNIRIQTATARVMDSAVGEYSVQRRQINILENLNTKRTAHTVAHEFAHHISYMKKSVMVAQNRFFEDRTKGENTITLPRYSNVQGKKDKWTTAAGDAYAGRIYKDNTYPEVISVGVELLYRNPAQFARDDPEWFNLVVGSLKGLPSGR